MKGAKKEEVLRKIADEVYRKTGIRIEERKFGMLERKVQKRMEELVIEDPEEYLAILMSDEMEFQELVNLITVNETYFFREKYQLEAFEEIVGELVRKKGLSYYVKVWSAGCSTGEEPYTIAMILTEKFPLLKFQVTATDIDVVALKVAKEGVYDSKKLRHVPPQYMKYFRRKNGMWEVAPNIKAKVKFSHLNLLDRTRMAMMSGFDFIFCRNVLIYFDDRSRREVVDMFYKALKPGGYIFLGHSESMGRISSAFLPVRKKTAIVYRKPEEVAKEMKKQGVKSELGEKAERR